MRQKRDVFRAQQMKQLIGGNGVGFLTQKDFTVPSNPYGKKRVIKKAPIDEQGQMSESTPSTMRTNLQPNVASSINENRKFDLSVPSSEVMRQVPSSNAPQLQRNFLPLHQSTPYQSTL